MFLPAHVISRAGYSQFVRGLIVSEACRVSRVGSRGGPTAQIFESEWRSQAEDRSADHHFYWIFSQSLPHRNVAELGGSLPLWGSLEQLDLPSPASPPLQGTELAALSTPKASLERDWFP